MFKQKSNHQLQVIENPEYEVLRTEPEQEQEAPRNGFVELGKMSFAASFGASLGWWLGEFTAWIVKIAIMLGVLLAVAGVVGGLMWASQAIH